MIKLGNLQTVMNILNPLFEEKCPVKLSLDILNVTNAIQPELDKIEKVKERIIDQYAIIDENGNKKTKLLDNGNEIYEFGENAEKVNEEMFILMETEVEIDKKIDVNNFSEDSRIEPIKLKILHDLGLIVQ